MVIFLTQPIEELLNISRRLYTSIEALLFAKSALFSVISTFKS